jgi:type IV secretion system protein VirB6
VHVYIIAVIAIYFLAFLSPLIIPAALFDYTKDIFDQWLKQLISYSLQPIILFAFLAILFAISDFVMLRKNTTFCPDTHSIMLSNETASSGKCVSNGDSGAGLCQDESAPMCILFKQTSVECFKLFGLCIPTWKMERGNSGEVILALMQLMFVFFVLNSLLPTIEELSHRLTDASGGGAVSMSQAKVQGPGATTAGVLAGYGKTAGGAIGDASSKITAARKR